jgi:hypothetical protein
MKWAPWRFRIWSACAFGAVTHGGEFITDVARLFRSARSYVAKSTQLVHQREIERPPEPPEPARDLAGPIHPVGTFLTAQDLEIAVCEPGGLQVGEGSGGVGRSSMTASRRLVG